MLIIRVRLSRLGSIEHDLLFRLLIRANQCSAAGSGNHLVPVKREYTIPSKRSANLSVVPAAQPFGGIFDNRNSILISNSHDFLNLCRHPVQINKDDRLRLLARLGNPVFYGLFQQYRIHIPSIGLRIHKNWNSPQISYWMRRGTKGKTLYNHFVSRTDTAGQQGQMHGSRAGGKSNNSFVQRSMGILSLRIINKCFQIVLKSVDIRTKRHNPIGIESFLDILLFHACLTHVSQT